MDLKKTKKLKRKLRGVEIQYKKNPPVHVYRSEDENAPFSEWERVTKKPYHGDSYHDRDAEENQKFYYYLFTEVDCYGNEGEPYKSEKDTYTFIDGKQYKRLPESYFIGMNMYWSTDPDLPLEQWTKFNEKPLKIENMTFKCPIKEPFFMYTIYVNALGNEIGQRSDIKRIVPRA